MERSSIQHPFTSPVIQSSSNFENDDYNKLGSNDIHLIDDNDMQSEYDSPDEDEDESDVEIKVNDDDD